jgi:hypothetical protein
MIRNRFDVHKYGESSWGVYDMKDQNCVWPVIRYWPFHSEEEAQDFADMKNEEALELC